MKLLTLTALMALAAGAAHAQTPPEPPAPPEAPSPRSHVLLVSDDGQTTVDTDRDGRITREEFKGSDEAFRRLAGEGADAIVVSELMNRRMERRAGAPGILGHDGVRVIRTDGHGERGEHGGVVRFVDRVRGGGAGDAHVIVLDGARGGDHADVMRVFAEHGSGEPHVVMLDGGPGGHGMHHGATRIELRDAAQMDADGDGRTSFDEFAKPLREAFDRMDADRSGFLEEGERGRMPHPPAPPAPPAPPRG